MMFTKSIIILVLVVLLTPPYNFAQTDTDDKITLHDFIFPAETFFGMTAGMLLLMFFIFKIQCYLDRRNNDVAAAATTAQGLSHSHSAPAATARGLSQSAAALQKFPVLFYSNFQKENHPTATAAGTEKSECAICLIEFSSGDKLTLLPCKHVYHPRCVGTWFISNTTCPLCRTDLISAVVADMV